MSDGKPTSLWLAPGTLITVSLSSLAAAGVLIVKVTLWYADMAALEKRVAVLEVSHSAAQSETKTALHTLSNDVSAIRGAVEVLTGVQRPIAKGGAK